MRTPLSFRKGQVTRHQAAPTSTSGSLASRYILSDTLGEGTYGKVVKALDTDTGQTVAVKTYTDTPDYNEIDVLFRFQHPNLLHGLDIVNHDGQCLVILPYGHSLLDYIKQKYPTGLSIGKCKSILFQLASAVHFMHSSSKYFHCDIKPGNIILVNGEVKLADFGLTFPNNQPNNATVACGTPRYGSIQSSKRSSEDDLSSIPGYEETQDLVLSDIHAIGATLYSCMTGEAMLKSLLDHMNIDTIMQTLYDMKSDEDWHQLCDLVRRMTKLRQTERMQSLEEVFASPLFEGEIPIPGDVTMVDIAGMTFDTSKGVLWKNLTTMWTMMWTWILETPRGISIGHSLPVFCLVKDLYLRTCSLVSKKDEIPSHAGACLYVAIKVMTSDYMLGLDDIVRSSGKLCTNESILSWATKITVECKGQLRSYLLSDATNDASCIIWYILSPVSNATVPKSELIQMYDESNTKVQMMDGTDVRKERMIQWQNVFKVQYVKNRNQMWFRDKTMPSESFHVTAV